MSVLFWIFPSGVFNTHSLSPRWLKLEAVCVEITAMMLLVFQWPLIYSIALQCRNSDDDYGIIEVDCYNFSIVFNILLLCLIYDLNLILGIRMYGKRYSL